MAADIQITGRYIAGPSAVVQNLHTCCATCGIVEELREAAACVADVVAAVVDDGAAACGRVDEEPREAAVCAADEAAAVADGAAAGGRAVVEFCDAAVCAANYGAVVADNRASSRRAVSERYIPLAARSINSSRKILWDA